MDYYVISYKHSSNGILTFWRPKNAGYTTDLKQAGKYSDQEIADSFTYYNNGYKAGKRFIVDNIAVPCHEVEKMISKITIDKSLGTTILHTKRLKKELSLRGVV